MVSETGLISRRTYRHVPRELVKPIGVAMTNAQFTIRSTLGSTVSESLMLCLSNVMLLPHLSWLNLLGRNCSHVRRGKIAMLQEYDCLKSSGVSRSSPFSVVQTHLKITLNDGLMWLNSEQYPISFSCCYVCLYNKYREK